ncbi:MAG: cell division protein CrgA [Actinobacteria bacterium 69-20]|nr:cell division protein CrgA [Actinomycetota bacterium]OJV25068.1 MAG: cell division protein CrgA [Actinobacteria bacterium 69-20]
MPKSKVRKKPQNQASRSAAAAAAAAAPRARVAGPSSQVYVGIMVGLMLLGLAWLVAYYLWPHSIPGMSSLGNWNFGVGFVLMIAGLVMTMRWR